MLRYTLEIVVISICGIGAFLLPLVIWPPVKLYDAPLFPLLRTSVESPRAESFIAIACVGFLAGLFCRVPAILIGLASMALFPLAAFAEIAKDSTSHNLIPIEIIMYGIYSIVPLLAGLLGRGLRRWTPLGR